MNKELTKEEVAERAKKAAQRLMAMPPQPQVWPKKGKSTKSRVGASKPRKRARVDA